MIVSSKEFANKIQDYIDTKLVSCLIDIMLQMKENGYIDRANFDEAYDMAYSLRDLIILWLRKRYNLPESDDKDF